LFFGQITGSQCEPDLQFGCFVGFDILIIEPQEQSCEDIGCALVPIKKWMVPRYAIGVRSRQRGKVRLAVGREVLWPGERRFEERIIANALRAAVLCNLFFMDRESNRLGNLLSHLASSRRILRSCFMISRAIFICFSNSGS